MKTSIFDATFTLPPMVEMIEVGKELPTATKGQLNSSLMSQCC